MNRSEISDISMRIMRKFADRKNKKDKETAFAKLLTHTELVAMLPSCQAEGERALKLLEEIDQML